MIKGQRLRKRRLYPFSYTLYNKYADFYILLSTMCFVYVFPRPFLHWSTNIRTNYQTIQGLDFKVNFDKVLRSHETLDKIFSPLPEPFGVPSVLYI